MPPRTTLHRATYALDRFVAVGAGGLVLTSTDGTRWSRRETPSAADLFGIDFAAQHWVAVGDGVILSSRDGIAWSESFADPEVLLRDVDYGASRFVAVGSGLAGDVLVSADGVAWTRVPSELPDDVDAVTWADGALFACSGTEVYRSPDGLAWTFVGIVPTSPLKDHLFEFERYDLAWTGSRLVWVGGTEAWMSEDGDEWSLAVTVDGCDPYSRFVGVLAAQSGIVLSGFGACPSTMLVPEAQLYTSVDGGASWTLAWREIGGGFPALAHTLGTFIAIGDRGDLLTSVTGLEWSAPGSGCTSTACLDGFSDVAPTESGVVAAGGVGLCDDAKRLGGGTIGHSADGATWTVSAVDLDRIRGVAWSEAGYAAVGDVWAASSIDGGDWQLVDVPSVWPLNAVAWGEGQYVAVGDRGTLLTSPDGSAWAGQWSTTTADLERVAWGEGWFVAVGAGGAIVSSDDTFTWERGATSSSSHLRGVAVGDQISVAVGDGGTILLSTDRSYWYAPPQPVEADLRDVAWSEGRFVAVGAEPVGEGGRAVVLASRDARHWTSFPVEAPSLRGVAGDGGQGFVAVGDDRTLLHATCIGTMLAADPQLVVARIGSSSELVLTVDEPAEVEVDIVLTTSDPATISLPGRVTLPRWSSSVSVPIEPLTLGTAWVTATLPAGLGGGSASSLVEVRPSSVAPRRPSHRLRP
jgi:hypothetical protein